MSERPWLVVVDPQRVFADPASPWGSPMFAAALPAIEALAAHHQGRVIVTRWLPQLPAQRRGSWHAYFEEWPFADRPPGDPLFDLVPAAQQIAATRVDVHTFGKWPALEQVTGPAPELILTGVSTDCCVLSTALAAAAAGATVRVEAAACAGSTPEAHERALGAMALYAPQITVV